MVFSSLEFIFWFLPIFLVIYYVSPISIRHLMLLLGSLFFYGFGEPKFLLLMVASIVVNYGLSFLMIDRAGNKHKLALIVSIIFNFSFLYIFKYLDFSISIFNSFPFSIKLDMFNLVLPLGISFYTFQIVSYMVDIYRGTYNRENNIIKFATYVCMFPQLIAGPIVNYNEVREQLNDRRVKYSDIEIGLIYFIIGLAYKVILANTISSLWNEVMTIGPLGINTAIAWLAAWGYSMQIYFDFFGYSLMAIGLGRMMGFAMPINFNNPYTAISVTDFWRRWHITLSRWFRDYVYIPLGGNRCSKPRMIFNILVVWLLTGLWHGADWNFIIWGLSIFVFLMLEKLVTLKFFEKYRFVGHIYMLFLIPIFWSIFNISDLHMLGLFLCRLLFIPVSGTVGANIWGIFFSMVKTYWWVLALCVIFATPYPMRFLQSNKKKWWLKLILFFVFWLCVYELICGNNNPFLYFRF